MKTHTFEASQWLPAPLDEVFAFFADPANLERITPPWVAFRIKTPGPLEMMAGALIDYRLKIRGVPIGWRTEITVWDPPSRFVDVQIKGPYRLWEHTHTFTSDGEQTRVDDHISYAFLGGPLIGRLFVHRDIERIFEFRRAELARVFGSA